MMMVVLVVDTMRGRGRRPSKRLKKEVSLKPTDSAHPF
jgi:hypothetical protein